MIDDQREYAQESFILFMILMAKTYKHKTLGWVAKKTKFEYSISHDIEGRMEFTSVVSELIENSSDREEVIDKEVIDKDRIDHVIYDLHSRCEAVGQRKIQKHMIRKFIEQHVPKQKMFTKEYIENHPDYGVLRRVGRILDLLEQEGLLSSDEQGHEQKND